MKIVVGLWIYLGKSATGVANQDTSPETGGARRIRNIVWSVTSQDTQPGTARPNIVTIAAGSGTSRGTASPGWWTRGCRPWRLHTYEQPTRIRCRHNKAPPQATSLLSTKGIRGMKGPLVRHETGEGHRRTETGTGTSSGSVEDPWEETGVEEAGEVGETVEGAGEDPRPPRRRDCTNPSCLWEDLRRDPNPTKKTSFCRD